MQNLENIYPRNSLLCSSYNAYHFHPRNFIHENFSLKQIIDDPRNFISSKISRPTLHHKRRDQGINRGWRKAKDLSQCHTLNAVFPYITNKWCMSKLFYCFVSEDYQCYSMVRNFDMQGMIIAEFTLMNTPYFNSLLNSVDIIIQITYWAIMTLGLPHNATQFT